MHSTADEYRLKHGVLLFVSSPLRFPRAAVLVYKCTMTKPENPLSFLPSSLPPFLLTLLCYYITFSLFKVIFKFIYIFDHILPLPQALPDPLPTHPTLSLFSKNIKTQYNNNIPPPNPKKTMTKSGQIKAHTRKLWSQFHVGQLLLNIRPALEWLIFPVSLY